MRTATSKFLGLTTLLVAATVLLTGCGQKDDSVAQAEKKDAAKGIAAPCIAEAGSWPLERDPYLLETSVPGVFAVGDVRHGSIKRVASGVGEGSMAIAFVHQYLAERGAEGDAPTREPATPRRDAAIAS
jgi:thioredoxin reductase (NADPH)